MATMVSPWVSGVGCRVSGVGCRVSGVGCRVSGEQTLVFPTPDTREPTPFSISLSRPAPCFCYDPRGFQNERSFNAQVHCDLCFSDFRAAAGGAGDGAGPQTAARFAAHG